MVSGVGGGVCANPPAGLSLSLTALGSACPSMVLLGVPPGDWGSSLSLRVGAGIDSPPFHLGLKVAPSLLYWNV